MLKSWSPVLQTVIVSGDRIFKEQWTLRVGPSPVWLVSLEEEEIRRSDGEETMWACKNKTAISKPKRGAFKETSSAHALILDLQPPELWENTLFFLTYNDVDVFFSFFFFFFIVVHF